MLLGVMESSRIADVEEMLVVIGPLCALEGVGRMLLGLLRGSSRLACVMEGRLAVIASFKI